MPSAVPTPVAAAIGLVPTVLSGVRRLPVKAVMLPVIAVSSALTALDSARHEYDELADRGEQLLARLGLVSRSVLEDVSDTVEDVAESTVTVLSDRVAGTADLVGEGAASVAREAGEVLESLQDGAATLLEGAGDATLAAAEAVGDAASAVATAGAAATDAGQAVLDATGQATEQVIEQATGQSTDQLAAGGPAPATTGEPELDPAQAPKGVPTPKATGPDTTRVDSAATEEVITTVEKVTDVAAAEPVTDHSELPLADYDHMTLGSLRGRLRSLNVVQLVQLRDYEKAHADRLPVVTMLDNRIAKLATDDAAAPSGGSQEGAADLTGGPSSVGKVAGPSGAHNSPSPPHGKVRLT